MNQRKHLNDLAPLKLSPKRREDLRRVLHESLVRTHGEHWAALQEMESKEDVAAANARIDQLQGPSPRDRAWLTQEPFGPEPPHVPGWDASNRVNLAVAKKVYDEYVAAGKIPRPAIAENSGMEATKLATALPRNETAGKIRWKRGTKKLREKILREAMERATRTPGELKIANDAWFDTKPGEATP